MSRYCVSIGEREYNVQVTDSQIFLNGEPVNLDLVSLNGNGLHLFCEGRQSREVYLGTHTSGVYEIILGGRRVIARVSHAHQNSRKVENKHEIGCIMSPMPGFIVEISVSEGEIVEEGQVVAVQESMKMQMQLKAPFTGKIEEIAVSPGAQVGKDTLIIRMVEI